MFNIGVVYVCVLTLLFAQTMPVYAGLISTDQIMYQQLLDRDRARLQVMLERKEAQVLLENHGVSTLHAQERINAMTDSEVQMFAEKFDNLPAAGDIGGAAALLILVLVIIILAISK
jgi:hypothetical protein